MEEETPELLPDERLKMPDAETIPPTVTTAAAFSGQAPIAKDKNDIGDRREES